MKRLLLLLIAFAALTTAVPVCADRYVVGDFCEACLEFPPADACRLYDDGLHGDGAAGDQLYGAAITVDRPAGVYHWYTGTPCGTTFTCFNDMIPTCWCSTPPDYASFWTSGPGEIVQFLLDLRPRTEGWQGCGLANDHGMPAGTEFDVLVDPPYADPPYGQFAASRTGTLWSCLIRFPVPGTHSYVFIARDRSVTFGLTYNAGCSACFPGEARLPTFRTTAPDTDVLMQFDESTGLVRALVGGVTPALGTSWGALKLR